MRTTLRANFREGTIFAKQRWLKCVFGGGEAGGYGLIWDYARGSGEGEVEAFLIFHRSRFGIFGLFYGARKSTFPFHKSHLHFMGFPIPDMDWIYVLIFHLNAFPSNPPIFKKNSTLLNWKSKFVDACRCRHLLHPSTNFLNSNGHSHLFTTAPKQPLTFTIGLIIYRRCIAFSK